MQKRLPFPGSLFVFYMFYNVSLVHIPLLAERNIMHFTQCVFTFGLSRMMGLNMWCFATQGILLPPCL